MRRSTHCAGLMLAVLVGAGRAAAEPGGAPPSEAGARPAPRSRVVILSASADDEILREAATRLAAELGAAGFEVVRVEQGPGELATPEGLRGALQHAAQRAGAFAAASVSRAGGGAAVDLWIVDRVTSKTVVRTVGGSGASGPSVIAVRAVELLQASLLEAGAGASPAPEQQPRAAPPSPGAAPGDPGAAAPGDRQVPEDVARWMAARPGAPAPPERPALLQGFGMEAGLALLQGAGGIGPAAGPMLRFSLGARLPRGESPSGRGAAAPAAAQPPGAARGGAGVLAGRLTLAGPLFAPELAGNAGTVSVRQELAALELVYLPEATGALAPVLSVGAGAYHLHAVGDPRAPYQSASGDVWAVLAGAGAGLCVRLGDRAALLLDVQLLFTEPRPVVQLAGQVLGSAGRPSLGGSLGLVAHL